MRARFAVCLALSVFVYAACGGRLVQTEREDGGNGASPGTSGSSSQGATANTGATSSRGGSSGTGASAAVGGMPFGGRFATAGASSSGGAIAVAGAFATGGACACPAIDCPIGYKVVPNVNGCCFHCESLCGGVTCPGVACASGSHAEMLPGLCCPLCVQDDCQQQQKNYQVFRQELLDKYSTLGCMTNTDCTVFYEKTQCAVGCGIAVSSSGLDNLNSNLQSYAQTGCSPDCPVLVAPCEPRPAPVCFQGRCQ
jgi:hypothetical protein